MFQQLQQGGRGFQQLRHGRQRAICKILVGLDEDQLVAGLDVHTLKHTCDTLAQTGCVHTLWQAEQPMV